MATTLHCDIVSAEKSIFSGSVEMIVATGVLGDLGIVPGHAALLTQLIPGPVKLTMEGGDQARYAAMRLESALVDGMAVGAAARSFDALT